MAAARILAEPLRTGSISDRHLAAVPSRRAWPARAVQRVQQGIQAGIVRALASGSGPVAPRALVRLLRTFPQLTALPAAFVGIGLRPEPAPEAARRQ
ncbi:hypothetical protein [Brevibacterium litoralis]|uniref:hypothetical protein n=1 Tax=Brevibacterium litoralis TaxID=3138935 RepID=UPI0032EC7BCF